MTDNNGNVINWEDEYRRQVSGYTYLLMKGYFTLSIIFSVFKY